MKLATLLCSGATAVILVCGGSFSAQVQTIVPAAIPGAKPVTVEHVKIHGTALEGNLEGDAVDRDVIVFLLPSYQKESARRYPVVYALHGYSIDAEQRSHEIHVPETIKGAFAQGSQEMIVVLPDSKIIYNGSMYSSSQSTGAIDVKLHNILDSYGVANNFEIYSGTHTSAVADRFQNHVVPFFSKNLCFTESCQ